MADMGGGNEGGANEDSANEGGANEDRQRETALQFVLPHCLHGG